MNWRAFLLAAAIPGVGVAGEQEQQNEKYANHMRIEFLCVAGNAQDGFFARYLYPEGFLQDKVGNLTFEGLNIETSSHAMTKNTVDFAKSVLLKNQESYTRSADNVSRLTEEQYQALGLNYPNKDRSNEVERRLATQAGIGVRALENLSPLCSPQVPIS